MRGYSAFTKKDDNIIQENKQKMYDKKVNDLKEEYNTIKDLNSNRAKQLREEAEKIGLSLRKDYT
tara:strand:- start:81 stop:275 length:195 start_codon:yes stop_codon:yes gene_type:complete